LAPKAYFYGGRDKGNVEFEVNRDCLATDLRPYEDALVAAAHKYDDSMKVAEAQEAWAKLLVHGIEVYTLTIKKESRISRTSCLAITPDSSSRAYSDITNHRKRWSIKRRAEW
jgi:hypothetical protein